MEVVILCGGQGTRIRDVTEDLPKPMIPIGDQPILWHIMKAYAHHGFNRFILCLGYRSWVIKRYFLDSYLTRADFSVNMQDPGKVAIHAPNMEEDWHVTLAETGLNAMTGARVKRIEKYITGDNFVLTYGDGVADINLRDLVDFHLEHGLTGTVTAVRPPGRFGEIELAGDRVTEFSEKPLTSRGRINGGFFVFHRRLFDRLDNGEDLVFEQAPLMQLARDGELAAYLHNGFWQPMDNSREYRYLNDLWREGQAPWKVWEPRRLRAAA
jgi:glucose-1-phosphate cytidylyltransferase